MDTRKPISIGVYYIGAPYGANEDGELISKHRDRQHAEKSLKELSKQDRYYNQLEIRSLFAARGVRNN